MNTVPPPEMTLQARMFVRAHCRGDNTKIAVIVARCFSSVKVSTAELTRSYGVPPRTQRHWAREFLRAFREYVQAEKLDRQEVSRFLAVAA